jgi:hypothetical protein
MYFESKKIALFGLGITALSFSRLVFFFFNDPEGPNLVVVIGLALILYLPSLIVYSLLPFTKTKKFWIVLLLQILLATAIYFCL